MKGFQHMLPGTDRMRISYYYWFIILKGPNDIWYDPVFCPVTSTNYITSPSSDNRFLMFLKICGIKIGIPVCVNDQFSTGLTRAIRIKPTQTIGLLIRNSLFLVMINFIRRYYNCNTRF